MVVCQGSLEVSMGHQAEDRKRLASLLNELAVHEGPQRTLIEGVELSRRSQPSPRIPVVYQPNIVIVGQGRKRCYLGGQVYQYDPFNYLVLSVPLPAESEWEASPEEPVLILAINPDPAMLGEMILDLDEPLPPAGPISRGISTTPMSEELTGAAIRLLECLKSEGCRPFGCNHGVFMRLWGVGWGSCSGSERSGHAPILDGVAPDSNAGNPPNRR